MIIKRANIISFGGLKNKEINFNNGINLIYGENEKGKSTIENFIRIWLFGMSPKRTKDIKYNERIKFTPINGERISGELYVLFKNREYIIRRTFGSSKKEDTSEIIDGLTGDTIKEIPSNEPGKYFLNINSSTFSKTLFIGQLGVSVNKDKEEDMMERASNLLGSGDENVSMQKAMNRLESLKKFLTTSRKTGKLDLLKSKYNDLVEERYKAYKLAKENIEDENKSIVLKNERTAIRKELENLEIYRRYLKKIKLQREYEEITKYLRKSEEIKKQQESIDESIITPNGIINNDLINEVMEEYGLFLNLLELKQKTEENLDNNKERYENKRDEFKDLLFIENIEGDLKNRFLRITIEQEVLKDKIESWEKINKEVKQIEDNIEIKKKSLGNYEQFIEIRSKIEELLKLYEEKLKMLKYKIENTDVSSNEVDNLQRLEKVYEKIKFSFIFVIIISILLFIFNRENLLLGVLIVLSLYLGIKLFNATIRLNSFQQVKVSKRAIELLKDEIDEIEKELFSYKYIVNAKNYEEFIKKLKEYDAFINYEEKERFRVNEKKVQLGIVDIEKLRIEYKNKDIDINRVLKLSNTNNINHVLEMMKEYDLISNNLLLTKMEIQKEEESLDIFNKQLSLKEERIRNKLSLVGLEEIELDKLEDKLLEIRQKIEEHNELERTLKSIEETYSALTKGKDIEAIKEELKDIITKDIQYSYNSEEEIDNQIRIKSNELIEMEKSLKDVESAINTRFIGKRQIATIEEEIEQIKENVRKYEIQLKAVELAIIKLQESFREVRENFGPTLNEKVFYYLKTLSSDKYEEVFVSDLYEIKLRCDRTLISSDLLSNGANDQLYLALRLAFISMIFEGNNVPVILDDAFVQYDDTRVEKALQCLSLIGFSQLIIFTCQKREKEILDNKKIYFNYIIL